MSNVDSTLSPPDHTITTTLADLPTMDDTTIQSPPMSDAAICDSLFMENFQTLKEVIHELGEQNLKRSHANIIDKFATKNISNELAEETLRIALERELLISYRYAQQTNYKIKSLISPTATIRDPVDDASTNTESEHYVPSSEFIKFKEGLMREMTTMKNAINQQQNIIFEQNTDQQSPQINILLKHIEFLQNTITTLVQNMRLPSPQPIIAPQTPHSNTLSPEPRPSTSAVPQPQPQPFSQPSALSAVSSTPQQPEKIKKPQKQVLIVGDSMLNCLDEKDMRRDAFVRIRNHPGATVEDLVDHVRAHTRHVKHDGIIIMAGQNDISRNQDKNSPKRDTMAHMQELVKQLKACSPTNAHIALCQVTARKDKPGIMKDVSEMNQQYKQFAQREQIGFVSTSHFEPRHTGKKGVHPNERGIDILFDTLSKYVNKISRL